jgi:L-threonylcarbamoyladenylate synthase
MITITKDIDLAVKILNNNGIIGFPTETVYGLAGNIFSEKAINSIFETKQRPKFNPLIVHISKIDHLENIAIEIPENAKRLANAFWPGPLTLLLKKHPSIPDLITAGKDTVAVRIPNHKMALAILDRLDFPLAAPSANPFGRISPTTAKHVADFFPNQIEAVFDGGDCENGIESTIVGFDHEKVVVYRLGAIAIEAIEKVVGKTEMINYNENAPVAPGMMKKHYAPKTHFIITNDVQTALKQHQNLKIGVLSFAHNYESKLIKTQEILSQSGDLKEASRKLYAAMHRLDKLNLDIIISEIFPDYDLGKSINDRLRRATEK